jgi:hypothetical protein
MSATLVAKEPRANAFGKVAIYSLSLTIIISHSFLISMPP